MAGERLTPLLVARHISKTFGSDLALDDVGLTVQPGEVHGLMGENGSGKSTLVRILAGYHAPAAGGRLEVAGRPVPLPLDPGGFRRLGLSIVHQDLGLIPSLTVAENLRLIELATRRRWRLRWRREHDRARRTLARVGLELDPGVPVESLRPSERALIAIARAIDEMPDGGSGVLVLDEPTAFLPGAEWHRLRELMRRIANAGSAVLFTSHDIGEVREATDRVTVLRDGRNAGTIATASVGSEELQRMIVGRPLAASNPAHRAAPRGGCVAARGVSGAVIDGVSLAADPGEVVGLTGLAGSGFDELPYLLFGALPCEAGDLCLGEEELDLTRLTPAGAIRAGVALVPGDPRGAGSVGSLPLADNLMLPALASYRGPFGLERRRMRVEARELAARFGISPRSPELAYGALSGGNQQKAQLAKWLHLEPRLLLLDEPTRGLDVGARRQALEMIQEAAAGGRVVLCASNDHEQLAALCDRVVVLAEGRVVETLGPGGLDERAIARACHRTTLEVGDAT